MLGALPLLEYRYELVQLWHRKVLIFDEAPLGGFGNTRRILMHFIHHGAFEPINLFPSEARLLERFLHFLRTITASHLLILDQLMTK